jgi:hypothetical protein
LGRAPPCNLQLQVEHFVSPFLRATGGGVLEGAITQNFVIFAQTINICMNVLDKSYVTISYDPNLKLLKTVWKGFANSDEYRAVLDFSLEFFKNNEVFYSFSDNRQMKAIRPTDQEYTNENFLPTFFKISTIKKSAVIISEDVFNRMATDSMLVKANDFIKFDMRYFDTEKEAMNWLKADSPVEA